MGGGGVGAREGAWAAWGVVVQVHVRGRGRRVVYAGTAVW